jgi:hypothetical protein
VLLLLLLRLGCGCLAPLFFRAQSPSPPLHRHARRAALATSSTRSDDDANIEQMNARRSASSDGCTTSEQHQPTANGAEACDCAAALLSTAMRLDAIHSAIGG